MFGRLVGNSLLRLPIVTRLPLRPASSSYQCARTLLTTSQRYYATPSRPKKAVGEPSRPVKRSVKRTAKKPVTTGEAKKQVEAKKKAAAKKPANKPAKRVLTAAQKEVAKQKLDKAKVSDLKKAALDPPKVPPNNAYIVYFQEKAKGATGQTAGVVKTLAQEWKQVTPAEREHYNHLAHEKRDAAQVEYKRWVRDHTPEQIQMANKARHALRNKEKRKTSKPVYKYKLIQDERTVKRPVSPYLQFSVDRHASGDFKHLKVTERSKLIGQEWKALTESEKKKYKDLHKEDTSRYVTEHTKVYGQMPTSFASVAPQQAASAAA